MDPNAALDNLLFALADGDRDSAIDAADDLASWLSNGGFIPWEHALSYLHREPRNPATENES